MPSSRRYKVSKVVFENIDEGGFNMVMGMKNAQPWHIPLLEAYIEELKKELEPHPGKAFA